MKSPFIGAIVNYVESTGQRFAAIITETNLTGQFLTIFYPGGGTGPTSAIEHGTTPGHWCWPDE